MKIILLDDNKETYEVLNEVASLSESEIIYFTDIEEAKKYIQENSDIDGIISEVYVGGKPAVQIVHFIKKLELQIPFIILTENISDEDREYFESLGVNQIMSKPFNPLEVLSEVVAYLKEYKGEDYVRSRLKEDKSDRSSLKLVIEKIIEFLKNLFSRKKKNGV